MGINNQALNEIKEAEDHEYLDKYTETVLPHVKMGTGGIKGVKDPYPVIKYRKFQGDSIVEEKDLNDIKNKHANEPSHAVIVPSLGGEPLEEPSAPEQPQAAVVVDPTRKEASVDVDSMNKMMQMMQVMMSKQANPPAPPLKATVVKEEEVEKVSSKTMSTVTFKGVFGEVTAPFDCVMDGDFCVALIQNSKNTFNYNPPIDEDAQIEMEWREGTQTRTQIVINAGLTFNLSKFEKVLVLLKL